MKDKVPGSDVGARARSAQPLGRMSGLLRWISRQRPWRVSATILAILFATARLAESHQHPLLIVSATVLGELVVIGYPLLVIFGFPSPYSTVLLRRSAWVSIVLLNAVALSGAFVSPTYRFDPDWLRISLGIPLTAAMFAPFFIATAVIGDARRALGRTRPAPTNVNRDCPRRSTASAHSARTAA